MITNIRRHLKSIYLLTFLCLACSHQLLFIFDTSYDRSLEVIKAFLYFEAGFFISIAILKHFSFLKTNLVINKIYNENILMNLIYGPTIYLISLIIPILPTILIYYLLKYLFQFFLITQTIYDLTIVFYSIILGLMQGLLFTILFINNKNCINSEKIILTILHFAIILLFIKLRILQFVHVMCY